MHGDVSVLTQVLEKGKERGPIVEHRRVMDGWIRFWVHVSVGEENEDGR